MRNCRIRCAVGLCALLFAVPAADQRADDKPSTGVPKGEVAKYVFNRSTVFPGTVRDYWVYVPRQYDPAKPACVYVNQDGIQFNAPAVFDQLIHRKEMPVVIGVFVTPGRVKAPSDKALDRFNRSFEYDGLGDRYARFLLEELLPEVEKKTASDGRPIRLSKDGNDRGIGGSSSGAVCAFTAAWERPAAFRRVFSAIGTYVGLRGASSYPTLIRKVEPKPLRVFLQDGSADLNIYGGDWWMANQEMERALAFAGYEVNHAWGTGGHNGKHATEIFPDAMRWLWKDWPAPVKAGAGAPQLAEIVLPGAAWEVVGEGYRWAAGAAANAKGEVLFDDVPAGKTYLIGRDAKPQLLRSGPEAGSRAFAPNGRMYTAAAAAKRVLAREADGKSTTVADGVVADHLVARHDGGLYFTNPDPTGRESSKVWYVDSKGDRRLVDSGLKFATGVTLSPDQSLLYVADGESHWVYSYQVQADGSLRYKQRFYHLHVPDTADDSGAGSLRVDRNGRLYVATRVGIQVCDQAGRVNVILPTPNGRLSDFCFGGPDFDTLFVFCGDRVFQRKLKVRSANSFEEPLKPAPPRL